MNPFIVQILLVIVLFLKLKGKRKSFMRFYAGLILSFAVFACAEYTVVSLGIWQWNRMHEKSDEKRTHEEALQGDYQAFDGRFLKFTPVRVSGQWAEAKEKYLANIRSETGMHRGYRVVKAFKVSPVRDVLVDVGWIPELPQKALMPSGEAAVLYGIIQNYPERKGWISGPTEGAQENTLLFFDPSAIAQEKDMLREPVYVQLTRNAHADVHAFHTPFPDSAQHLEYMLTWFIIAIIWPLMYVFAVMGAFSKARRECQQGAQVLS